MKNTEAGLFEDSPFSSKHLVKLAAIATDADEHNAVGKLALMVVELIGIEARRELKRRGDK